MLLSFVCYFAFWGRNWIFRFGYCFCYTAWVSQGRLSNIFVHLFFCNPRSHHFLKFCTKISMFQQNFDFRPKFRLLMKIWFLSLKFDFWSKFEFLIKNFDIWPKFRFLIKIKIFWPKFRVLTKISILPNISIFGQNFNFWFLSKIDTVT